MKIARVLSYYFPILCKNSYFYSKIRYFFPEILNLKNLLALVCAEGFYDYRSYIQISCSSCFLMEALFLQFANSSLKNYYSTLNCFTSSINRSAMEASSAASAEISCETLLCSSVAAVISSMSAPDSSIIPDILSTASAT